MYNFQKPSSLDIQASYYKVIIEQSNDIKCTIDIKTSSSPASRKVFIHKENVTKQTAIPLPTAVW
jgi:hypothetical protein